MFAVTAGSLLGACASFDSSVLIDPKTITVIAEDTPSTQIDLINAWKTENSTIVTGRVWQRGYGSTIFGHIHIEHTSKNSSEIQLIHAALERRNSPRRQMKKASFYVDIGNIDLTSGETRIRYHDENHTMNVLPKS